MSTISETFGVDQPRIHKFGKQLPCTNPDLVVGLELEIENCMGGAEWYQRELKKLNFDVKTDGSLRGVAYEFITKPMAMSSALGALDSFFEITKFNKENYSDRCSIHVHVNCTDMQLEQVSSLALLYTTVEEILFEFVGSNRDSNIYCIPWNQCRQHFNLVHTFLNEPGKLLRAWSKYTALNLIPLSHIGTVEFRQMHGTSDMGKITQWLNIIGRLFNVAKATPLNNLIGEIKGLNSTSQYEVFFNRIFGGVLPYNEAYREKMEAGVILAKYSLISMEKKVRTRKEEAPEGNPYAQAVAALQAQAQFIRNEVLIDPAGRHEAGFINAFINRNREAPVIRQRPVAPRAARQEFARPQAIADREQIQDIAPPNRGFNWVDFPEEP